MNLSSLTRAELIFPGLRSADRSGLLHTLAERLAELGIVKDAQELFDKLWEREQLGSTGIGSGVAIPHCKIGGLDKVVLAIGILEQGIDFGAVDQQPVRLFFLVISPASSPAAHLQCLAAISKWIKVEEQVRRILDLETPDEIHQLIEDAAV